MEEIVGIIGIILRLLGFAGWAEKFVREKKYEHAEKEVIDEKQDQLEIAARPNASDDELLDSMRRGEL